MTEVSVLDQPHKGSELCPECGEGFTNRQWMYVHSDQGLDVHEHCCRDPFCAEAIVS